MRVLPATLIGRAGKENKIPVGVLHDEGSGAPRLLLQRLAKAHPGGLVTQEKLLDLVRGGDGERSRQQLLTLSNIANEHGFADHPQIEPSLVAGDLCIEWRVAIDGSHREAELIRIEIARRLDVGNEQLCFRGVEKRAWYGLSGFVGRSRMVHGIGS